MLRKELGDKEDKEINSKGKRVEKAGGLNSRWNKQAEGEKQIVKYIKYEELL